MHRYWQDLGWHVRLCKLRTELWPLIDVRILFPLNILRNNWWILTKLCWKSRLGMLYINCCPKVTDLCPSLTSEFCFQPIPWEEIDKFQPTFACALMLTRSRLGFWHAIIDQIITDIRIAWHQNFDFVQYHFCQARTELLPLIAISILFTLSILRNINLAHITYCLLWGYPLCTYVRGGILSKLWWLPHLSHITRKPVFGVCNQVRLKPACSAIETS